MIGELLVNSQHKLEVQKVKRWEFWTGFFVNKFFPWIYGCDKELPTLGNRWQRVSNRHEVPIKALLMPSETILGRIKERSPFYLTTQKVLEGFLSAWCSNRWPSPNNKVSIHHCSCFKVEILYRNGCSSQRHILKRSRYTESLWHTCQDDTSWYSLICTCVVSVAFTKDRFKITFLLWWPRSISIIKKG